MKNKNTTITTNHHEAAEGQPPAASASVTLYRENPMDKVWTFLGGMLTGTASVVAAAVVADRLTSDEGGGEEQKDERVELLALPENTERRS